MDSRDRQGCGAARRGVVALLGVCVSLALVACGANPAELLGLESVESQSFGNETVEAQDVFVLTNSRRVAAGLPPLTWHPGVAEVAYDHSRYMQQTDLLSHLGPGGIHAGQRLSQGGVSWIRWTENVARGHRAGAEAVVEAWMTSDFHRANILHPDMTHVGVGALHDETVANPGPWWTQDFIIPPSDAR